MYVVPFLLSFDASWILKVLPGTPSMQAPFGAYWPPGDMYGGSMSNGVS